MAQTVEISLRVPSLRVRRAGTDAIETITNSNVRFSKQLEVETVPKPGDVLGMVVSSGDRFDCEVVRRDWVDEKNMFVVTCRYAKRSISPVEYQALVDSRDWQMRALV